MNFFLSSVMFSVKKVSFPAKTAVFTLTKQKKPLDIPQNCVRSIGTSITKNKDPKKFHIIFSCSPLEIQLRF